MLNDQLMDGKKTDTGYLHLFTLFKDNASGRFFTFLVKILLNLGENVDSEARI